MVILKKFLYIFFVIVLTIVSFIYLPKQIINLIGCYQILYWVFWIIYDKSNNS